MRVLITGGAGFIGSHIVNSAVANDFEAVVIDNLSTGKKDNIRDVIDEIVFYNVDIRSETLNEIFNEERPEVVIHHAAQINVRSSIRDPVFDAMTNVIGSINILECCRRYDVKKIIYASSGGAVYGEPNYLPVDENHPVSPLSPYGASKYSVEKYIDVYHSVYGLKYTILRYGNVYGPRQDPAGEAGVVAIFTNRLTANKPIVVYGDGNQTRDFVYVADIARANMLALEKNVNGVFNIGSGIQTSVNDIVKGLEDALSTKAVVNYQAAIPGEVRHIYLSISKAKTVLGFEPLVTLKEGLKKTIEWNKQYNQKI
jgi:UDP-glucose 4-epimerase